MLNQVSMQGRITKDPELRSTPGGKDIVNFSIAVDRDWTPGGEKETDFFNCVAFNNTATKIYQHFQKGKPILIRGKVQQDKWQDSNGQNRTSVKIYVEQFWFELQDRYGSADQPTDSYSEGQKSKSAAETEPDDDLPF